MPEPEYAELRALAAELNDAMTQGDRVPRRAGGCAWFEGGIRVQYARCEPCQFGGCPGGPHPWAGVEDIEHAAKTGQPDPSDEKCGCVCADGPSLEPDEPDPDDEPESLTAEPCPVCGEAGACAWDAEGRPLIHALGEDDDA